MAAVAELASTKSVTKLTTGQSLPLVDAFERYQQDGEVLWLRLMIRLLPEGEGHAGSNPVRSHQLKTRRNILCLMKQQKLFLTSTPLTPPR